MKKMCFLLWLCIAVFSNFLTDANAETATNTFLFKCRKPESSIEELSIEPGLYTLGMFLHSTDLKDLYSNTLYKDSVNVRGIPYIKNDDSGKIYIFVPDGDTSNYVLNCVDGTLPKDVIENITAEKSIIMVLTPTDNDRSSEFSKQKQLQKHLKDMNVGCEFFTPTERISSDLSKATMLTMISNGIKNYGVPCLDELPPTSEIRKVNFKISKLDGTSLLAYDYEVKNQRSNKNAVAAPSQQTKSLAHQSRESFSIWWESSLGLYLKSSNCNPQVSPISRDGNHQLSCSIDDLYVDLKLSHVSRNEEISLKITIDELKNEKPYIITREKIREIKDGQMEASNGIMIEPGIQGASTTIPVKLELPEAFKQVDVTTKIRITPCQDFKRDEDQKNIYTGTCTGTPEDAIKIDGFVYVNDRNENQREIPVISIPSDNEYNLTVSSEGIKAQFPLKLNEGSNFSYSIDGKSENKITSAGESLSARLDNNPFPTKVTFKFAQESDSQGDSTLCDFSQEFSLDEAGKEVQLNEPCRKRTIKPEDNKSLPDAMEPAIILERKKDQVIIAWKKGANLEVYWKDATIKSQTILADELEKYDPYTVRVERTPEDVLAIFDLPEIFAANDLSAFLTLPNICKQDTLQWNEGEKYYTAKCKKNMLKKLKKEQIIQLNRNSTNEKSKQVLSFHLESNLKDDIYRIKATPETNDLSIEIVLLGGYGLKYQVIEPSSGQPVLIEEKQPIPYSLNITNPQNIRFQTENPLYAVCNFSEAIELLKWLTTETPSYNAPCEQETIQSENSVPMDTSFSASGCINQPVFNKDNSAFTCVRKRNDDIVMIWPPEKAWDLEEKIPLSDKELDESNDHWIRPIQPKGPLKIDENQVGYNFNTRFVRFSTLDQCQTADMQQGKSSQYALADIEKLSARPGSWAVVVENGQRISKCAQGVLQENGTVLFNMLSDQIEGKRLVIAIENSKPFSENGRGQALREGLIEWLGELKTSAQTLPLNVMVVQDSGDIVEILRGEELEQLPIQDNNDASRPTIRQKIEKFVDLGKEGFQPLRHFITLEGIVPKSELGKVFYVTDSQSVPEELAGPLVGTLFLWQQEGISVNILTNATCDKWQKYEKANLVKCDTLPISPSTIDITERLNSFIRP